MNKYYIHLLYAAVIAFCCSLKMSPRKVGMEFNDPVVQLYKSGNPLELLASRKMDENFAQKAILLKITAAGANYSFHYAMKPADSSAASMPCMRLLRVNPAIMLHISIGLNMLAMMGLINERDTAD
jgi:hypothetical protein